MRAGIPDTAPGGVRCRHNQGGRPQQLVVARAVGVGAVAVIDESGETCRALRDLRDCYLLTRSFRRQPRGFCHPWLQAGSGGEGRSRR